MLVCDTSWKTSSIFLVLFFPRLGRTISSICLATWCLFPQEAPLHVTMGKRFGRMARAWGPPSEQRMKSRQTNWPTTTGWVECWTQRSKKSLAVFVFHVKQFSFEWFTKYLFNLEVMVCVSGCVCAHGAGWLQKVEESRDWEAHRGQVGHCEGAVLRAELCQTPRLVSVLLLLIHLPPAEPLIWRSLEKVWVVFSSHQTEITAPETGRYYLNMSNKECCFLFSVATFLKTFSYHVPQWTRPWLDVNHFLNVWGKNTQDCSVL